VREFLETVARVAAGGTALDRELITELVRARSGTPGAEDTLAALTPRARETLALMAEGRSNAAIARAMVVTQGAVEKHVSNVFANGSTPDRSRRDSRRSRCGRRPERPGRLSAGASCR
jgi:DNA-binding NarL/FixJ family response regulator